MLDLVKLSAMADRLPRQLSGGQQQRIALARALAVKPSILLLDEPFAALDKNLRLDMQIEIKRIQRLAGTTTVLVTHDQEEALSMADRVAVLSQGRLEQYSVPTEVYDRPASYFVNTFVGSCNVFKGTLSEVTGSSAKVRLAGGQFITGRLASPDLASGLRSRSVSGLSICALRLMAARDFWGRWRWACPWGRLSSTRCVSPVASPSRLPSRVKPIPCRVPLAHPSP